MKSALEILLAISTVCPKFPDPACLGVCICHADIAAIRAAQIDAAEWMREEAAKVAEDTEDEYGAQRYSDLYCGDVETAPAPSAAIRSIKLPGDGE